MIPLILFVALAIVVLVAFEWRARHDSRDVEQTDVTTTKSSTDDGCCGMHLVCEKETLLQTNAEIIYYDDEELDALAGIDPIDFTPNQYAQMRHVFDTMMEKDVPGWVRSLQLRHIELPADIREEALLIVQERRHWNETNVAKS